MQVRRFEEKVVRPLAAYGTSCKHAKVRTIYDAVIRIVSSLLIILRTRLATVGGRAFPAASALPGTVCHIMSP